MPNWKRIVREHLAALRLSPEREIEIVEEQALHLEAAYEAALADGLSEAEAEARALRSYDWRLLECELSRAEQPLAARAFQPSLELIERKGGIRLGTLWQDLLFGARMLRKQPGGALIVVLTLALGIGANTAIFSVINGVLLRPLAFHEPDRLVMLWTDNPGWRLGFHELPATPADLPEWRAAATSFEQIAAFQSSTADLSDGGDPERIGGVDVSANLLPLLGV